MPFNMFPYSDLHNINADWLLKTVKEAAEDAQEAAQDAQTAAQTAEGMQDQIDILDSRMDSCEGSLEDVVKYTAQSENTTRQSRARLNIGAASQADMTTAQHDIQDKVDINQGHMVDPRIYSSAPGSTTGAALIAVPPNSVALQPVTNGNVDGSSYAKLMVATPTGNNDAATKKYVDDTVSDKVDKNAGKAKDLILQNTLDSNSGICLKQGLTGVGTTQRDLELHDYILEPLDALVRVKIADPYENSHAATKRYVDSAVGNAVMVNTIKLNEEETGYESQYTYDELFAKLDANKPVLFCLEHEDYPDMVFTGIPMWGGDIIGCDIWGPADPNSASECVVFRIFINEQDAVTVSDYHARLVPIPQIGDEGKALVVGNNMRPAWSESGPLVVDVNNTTTTTTFAQLVTAINAGRQIIVRHTRGTTNPVIYHLTNYVVSKHLNTSTGLTEIQTVSFRYFFQDTISAGTAELIESDIITWYSNGTFEVVFDEM